MGRDLQIFTLGDDTTSPFRLNPFQFVRGYPLHHPHRPAQSRLQRQLPDVRFHALHPGRGHAGRLHRPRLGPGHLHQPLHRRQRREDYVPYLPTMEDLYRQIDVVVERKKYAQQLSMDISAALKARIKSLLVAGKGAMLNTTHSTRSSCCSTARGDGAEERRRRRREGVPDGAAADQPVRVLRDARGNTAAGCSTSP